MRVLIKKSPNGWYNIYKKEVGEVADLVVHRKVDIDALLDELPAPQVIELSLGYVVVADIESSWLIHTEINDEII